MVPPSLPEEDWLAPLFVPVDDELPLPVALPPLDESLPDDDDGLPLPPDVPGELPMPDEELDEPDDEPPMPALSTPRALAVLSSRRPVIDRLLDF